MRLEFHILLFSSMPLSFVSQARCLPMTESGASGGREWKKVLTPSRGLGPTPPALSWQPGQEPSVTSANLAFSSSWKGENVATTEVADIVGLVDFVQEVNVYGVPVPGMHNIL